MSNSTKKPAKKRSIKSSSSQEPSLKSQPKGSNQKRSAPKENPFIQNIMKTYSRIKVFFLYHFRLMPRIRRMKQYVLQIASMKMDFFPSGKSLFVFPGKDDTLYFIIFKEERLISIMEVYDELLNRIPARYQILPRIQFHDLFAPSSFQ